MDVQVIRYTQAAKLDRALRGALEGGSSGGGRRHPLVLVASLVDKVPNLAGLTRTCEVFGCALQFICVDVVYFVIFLACVIGNKTSLEHEGSSTGCWVATPQAESWQWPTTPAHWYQRAACSPVVCQWQSPPACVHQIMSVSTTQGCRAGGGGYPRHGGPRVPPDFHDRRAVGAPALLITFAATILKYALRWWEFAIVILVAGALCR